MAISVGKSGSSSSGFSFTTFQGDAGTSPAADSSTDTVNFTSTDGSITITGDASTDTLDFVVSPSGAPVDSVSNADGSLTISPTTGAVVGALNVAHSNTWSALQNFNYPGVTRSPQPPTSPSLTFNVDATGYTGDGSSYQYYIYGYYNDGVTIAYDAIGVFVSGSIPNDALVYRNDLSWTAGADTNGYIVFDFLNTQWIDIGSQTAAGITPGLAWTAGSPPAYPVTLYEYNTGIWSQASTDYVTTDMTVMKIGYSAPDHLRFHWLFAGGPSSQGALRFEDSAGTLRYIEANLYGSNATLINQLTVGTVAATSILASTVSASAVTTKQVIHSQSGALTGDAGFEYDFSTNRLLVASASLTAQSKIHVDGGTGTASELRFTAGTTTGQTSSDGFQLGITATGVGEIRQRENAAIDIYTLNTLRATYDASSSPRYTVYGGIQANYDALASTSTDGFISANNTSATGGSTIQRPGRIRFSGRVWNTSASKQDDWIIQPVLTSAATPTSVMSFERQYDGGGYSQYLSLSSAGLLTTFGNITLTPSGGGGSGANRTISFGNGYANPALYLYDGGATTRYGWGMQAGSMQFFAASSAGNTFTWNIGGDLNASGTNEILRLVQYAAGTGAGLSLGTAGFSATTPYRIDLRSVTATTGSAGVENMIRLARDQTGGVSYPQAFAIGIGRYSSSGLGPDTRVDFSLKATAATDYTPGVTVMSLNANGRVGIGVTAPATALEVLATTEQIRASYDASNYLSTTVSSTGVASIEPVGTDASVKLVPSATKKFSIWNATPIVQPTSAIAAATFVANTSGIANDTATFDGYTIGQIVKALRNMGALA